MTFYSDQPAPICSLILPCFALYQQDYFIFFMLTVSRQQILDSSKLKEFADDNFKFYKNGRKLSKRVENTVGKGEIARYEQFLLFPQFFQKACFPGASKAVTVWEWVNSKLTLPYCCYAIVLFFG